MRKARTTGRSAESAGEGPLEHSTSLERRETSGRSREDSDKSTSLLRDPWTRSKKKPPQAKIPSLSSK